MNTSANQNPASGIKLARSAIVFLKVAALLVVAFAFYTGEPVFFLKWFFGLQADD